MGIWERSTVDAGVPARDGVGVTSLSVIEPDSLGGGWWMERGVATPGVDDVGAAELEPLGAALLAPARLETGTRRGAWGAWDAGDPGMEELVVLLGGGALCAL